MEYATRRKLLVSWAIKTVIWLLIWLVMLMHAKALEVAVRVSCQIYNFGLCPAELLVCQLISSQPTLTLPTKKAACCST